MRGRWWVPTISGITPGGRGGRGDAPPAEWRLGTGEEGTGGGRRVKNQLWAGVKWPWEGATWAASLSTASV